MFIFISNEPIKVAQVQKLSNQSMLNGALMKEMVNNSFSESKKNFSRLKNQKRSNEKKQQIYGQRKLYLFPIDFSKYLSYSEMQKNCKVVNV